jgi:hypothetical protein
VIGDFWKDVNTGAYGGSTLAQGQQWFNTSLEGSANINSQVYGIRMVCTQNNWSFGGCGYLNPLVAGHSRSQVGSSRRTSPPTTAMDRQGATRSSPA